MQTTDVLNIDQSGSGIITLAGLTNANLHAQMTGTGTLGIGPGAVANGITVINGAGSLLCLELLWETVGLTLSH